MSGGCNCHRTFDHAAEHNLQVMSARNMDHFQGMTNATALHEFNHDAINASDQARNVIDSHTAFIGHDWKRDMLADKAQTVIIVGSNGLFYEFDIVGGHGLNISNGLFGRPRTVGINTPNC